MTKENNPFVSSLRLSRYKIKVVRETRTTTKSYVSRSAIILIPVKPQ